MQCCKMSMMLKPSVVAVCLNGLNHFKIALRIFRIIQEAGALEHFQMEIQITNVREMLTRYRRLSQSVR
jgi:hypothetical protein